MNTYTRRKINEQLAKIATMKDKLCLAQIELNKAKYKQLSNMVLHDGEYITQAELSYLERPSKRNWIRAMRSLNQNFVVAARRD